jgi:hypothetical protein
MGGRVAILWALILSCSISYGEEIPLSDVWALNMPGTKDLSTIKDKRPAGYQGPLRSRLFDTARQTLLKKFPEKEARPGFAVSGTGRAALARTSQELYKTGLWSGSPLPSNDEISLVFFSYPSAYFVQLVRVERHDNVFRVVYRAVPHYSPESTIQLALIPVGKLTAGEYEVEIVQLPMDEKYVEAGFESFDEEATKRTVCQPYTFEVYERPAPDPGSAKGATVIPLDQIWAWRMPGTKPMKSSLQADSKYSTEEGALLAEIRRRLSKMPGTELPKKAEAGFVVSGTGMDAMKKAHAILLGKEKRQDHFKENQELSLVFFSYRATWYVHLHDIVIKGDTIKVRFKFVPHNEQVITNHFALIPINGLKAGKYKVVVERLPLEQKYVDIGWPPRPASSDNIVSDSFSFSVGGSTEQPE